ncbi:MAG: FAD-dependent oxidoreductase [Bacilli bacterium]
MENANFGRILFRILLSVLKAIDNLTFMSHTSINRRKFLSKSAMSLFGYSLMVSVPASPDAKGGTAAISDVGRRIDEALSSPQFSADSENYMAGNILNCDVLVLGGGMAGICAAIAAARNGAKVVLVQDRSRLGGNASSEIKMHPLGVDSQKYGFREGGILEEILLENAVRNPQNSWEIWDLLLYDKCISEPNIALILDTFVYRAETEAGKIKCVYARSDKTLNIYKITADVYIDCRRLPNGHGSGAELRAAARASPTRRGRSCPNISARRALMLVHNVYNPRFRQANAFKAPSWAKKITARDLKFRDPRSCGFDYGYWFISHGGLSDTVRDNEVIRFELLSTVLGVWDYIKNSGKYPEADNRAIDTIGMIPGKRDSYRIKGIKVFKQFDIRGEWKNQPDSVGAVGWKLEDQPSGGFYDTKTPPAMPHRETPPFNIPLPF